MLSRSPVSRRRSGVDAEIERSVSGPRTSMHIDFNRRLCIVGAVALLNTNSQVLLLPTVLEVTDRRAGGAVQNVASPVEQEYST